MLDGIRAAAEADPVGSDLHLQALRPLLRKLFMCRAIGDGFGAIVDALISALENNRGRPLETVQLQALRNALVKLREEPFLSFANAMKIIEDVELVGFSTQPPGFEQLADWLTV